MHTTNSDGENSILEMAKKGLELGYDYIGITDHFGKLKSQMQLMNLNLMPILILLEKQTRKFQE